MDAVTICRPRARLQQGGGGPRLGASFASYLVTTVEMLWLAKCQGLDGYVLMDAGNSPIPYYDDPSGQANMWDWFFEQPFTSNRPQATWHYATPWVEQLYRRHDRQPMPPDFTKRVLRFKPEVVNRAEMLLAEHGLAGGYVAVSHRGTDRIFDGTVITPIERYWEVLDPLRERKLMVIPEEDFVLRALRARYPDCVHPACFYCTPDGHREMVDWTSPKTGRERGFDVALMLYLFVKADVLVRNVANLSALAARMRTSQTWQVWPGRPPTKEN